MTLKEYVRSIHDVAMECGLDPEEVNWRYNGEAYEAADRGEKWVEGHHVAVVKGWKEAMSPEQLQKYMVDENIWPPMEPE